MPASSSALKIPPAPPVSQTATQEDLLERGRRYQWLIENTADSFWRLELDQPMPLTLSLQEQVDFFYKHAFMAECNEGTAKIYGFATAAEMTGLRLGQMLVREDPRNLQTVIAFVRSGYKLLDAESVEVDKQGNPLYFVNSLIGVVENGLLQRAWGMSRDVTERKRAEEALRESEARFRLVVERVREYAIFTLDALGNISSWNVGAERIFGYQEQEILGRSGEDFFTEEDRRWHAHDVELRLAAQQGQSVDERWYLRKNGARFWGSSSTQVLRDDRGHIHGYAKIMRDRTERKKSEEYIRYLNAELESRVQKRTAALQESTAQMETFTYTVAHDLRAPLRAMFGLSQALLDDYSDKLDEVGQDFLRRIVKASGRMDVLIQDLLSYSQLASGDFHLESVPLDDVAAGILAALAEDLKNKGAEVKVEGPLPAVTGHRSTLETCLSNLLVNACKFVGPGVKPQVVVRAEKYDEWVRLWVEDNGLGIAPEHQQRIFYIFERLHSVEAYAGTGLGLALVKKGTERMGGRVGVESKPGAGSRFWIELPLK